MLGSGEATVVVGESCGFWVGVEVGARVEGEEGVGSVSGVLGAFAGVLGGLAGVRFFDPTPRLLLMSLLGAIVWSSLDKQHEAP